MAARAEWAQVMVNGVARCLTQLVVTDLDGTLYWGDGRHALLLRRRTMEWIGRAWGWASRCGHPALPQAR